MALNHLTFYFDGPGSPEHKSWGYTIAYLTSAVGLIVYMTFTKTPYKKSIYERYKAWEYVWRGPGIIQEGYDQANGRPFDVLTPDTRYVFVSSPKHIEELDKAPDAVLSLQAAAKHMLQPKYTMHGFSWFDMRGTEGTGFERALRTLLTSHLPNVLPDLGRFIRVQLGDLKSKPSAANRTRETRLFPLMKELVAMANAYMLFGKDICNNEAFMKAASSFMDETLAVAEIIRLVPSFAVPIIGKLTSIHFKSDKKMYDTLITIVDKRLQERDMRRIGQETPSHSDCIQWIIETSPKKLPWSAERIVWELMAIWFGACYSLSVTSTFTIIDLCRHPEYIKFLRGELENEYLGFVTKGQGLPLLDSFLKESARQHPVESMSTRRHAMKPFAFSDGTKLGVGDWSCTPVHAINHDPTYYPDPYTFNGFRFVKPEILEKANAELKLGSSQPEASDLTEVSSKWQFWGTGRMACPGRFYASMVLKVIIGEVISNYDMCLLQPGAASLVTWRSTFFPRDSFKVMLTPMSH